MRIVSPLLPGHLTGTVRQRDGDDGGKELRSQADRECEREEERFEYRAVENDVHDEDPDDERRRDSHEQEPEPTQTQLQRSGDVRLGDAGADPTELGVLADGGDHGSPGPAGNVGAAPHSVGPIAQAGRSGEFAWVFLHGEALARQGRLVEEERVRVEHAGVGGDHVARSKHEDVSGNDVVEGHLGLDAVAEHRGMGANRGQPLDEAACIAGPERLGRS